VFIEAHQSKEEIFRNIKKELLRATVDKRHPFRFTVLGSQGEKSVQQRYVVLRSIREKLHFIMYTDYRSDKCEELQQSSSSSLLFYHPTKKLQVRVTGEASIHRGDALARKEWDKVQGEAVSAYTSTKAPGSEINSPEESYEWTDPDDQNYFSVIRIKPHTIEALQLNRSEHLRIRFLLNEDQNIQKAQWLTP